MYNYPYMYNNQDTRFGFAVPFLLGGLVGGAAVGVSRPRPVVVTQPYPPYPPYPGMYPFRPYY